MSRENRTLRRALASYSSERPALAGVVALGMAATAAEGLALVLLVGLAQNLGTDVATVDLWRVSVGERTAVSLAAAGAASFIALRFAAAWLQARAQTRWEADVRHRLATAYAGAQPTVQRAARDNRLVELTTRLVDLAGVGLVNLASGARAATSAAVLVSTALVVDPVSAAVMAAVSVVLLGALRPVTSRVRAAAAVTTESGLDTSDQAAELAAAARDARLFDVEDHFIDRAGRAAHDYELARRRSQTLIAASPVFYQGFGLLLAASAVGLAVVTSGIELEAFGVVAVLLLRTLSYGQHVQSTYQRLVATIAPLDEIETSLAAWRRATNHHGDTELARVRRVQLDSVSYAYGTDDPALRGVDLECEAGSSLAIVGPSGAGKSTLAQVLIRYLRPTSGALLVNGRPADCYTPASWAANVAFVPQQAHLVHGTVRENIGFFRRQISDADIVSAARLAGVHHVIEALPDGYDTRVGASERVLSGGQVQRIGIARALAGRPSLLVLDEPTSALDADSESVIVETLRRLPEAMTVIVIAHRLSTISHCDAVLVLVDGAAETFAPHDVARSESPYYRRALAGTT